MDSRDLIDWKSDVLFSELIIKSQAYANIIYPRKVVVISLTRLAGLNYLIIEGQSSCGRRGSVGDKEHLVVYMFVCVIFFLPWPILQSLMHSIFVASFMASEEEYIIQFLAKKGSGEEDGMDKNQSSRSTVES